MRFLDNTPDIPKALIEDVVKGNAVFLCGAGVSMRANMPSFKKLTEDIYSALGEVPDNEPAERIAIDRGEFDRALRSLEKRTLLPKNPSQVRVACANLLTPAVALAVPDHTNLLRLSRDSEGRPKLMTTNFDPLFERAAAAAGMPDVRSHAAKALPRPGTGDDHGILHIHGRIGDVTTNTTPSDLILTSADFGDAYLRDGWASQYIEDRTRLNTLVLVGYAAEDAAMRLLLETLDADRQRFPDLKPIYAIEVQTATSSSQWKSKGIEPIEFVSYDQIYEVLAEWANYAVAPSGYSRAKVKHIFGRAGGKTP